jgi:hypothetical protein
MINLDFEEIRQKLIDKADGKPLFELDILELNHYDGWADSTEAMLDERINTEDEHFLKILIDAGIIEPTSILRITYKVI